MDDARLAEVVNRSALRLRAIPQIAKRWEFLACLHKGLVADLRARRLDRDLATVHADMVIEAVLEAVASRPRWPQMTVEGLERRVIASDGP